MYAVRVARLDRARAALPRRPPDRRGRGRWSSTRACSCSGCRRRRGGCRSCRRGSASAPTSWSRLNARDPHRHVALRRRRGAAWPCRPSTSTSRSSTCTAADAARQRPVPRTPTPTWTTSCAGRPTKRFMRVERIVPTEELAKEGRAADAADQPARWSTAWSRRRTAPTSPSAPPDYGRDEAFQKEYAASGEVARGVGRVPRPKYLDCGRRGRATSE